MLNNLPFSKIGDENMIMTLHGMDDESIGIIGAPSFSIKSLLDEISNDSDQFISDTIYSKYYTIADFSRAKFDNKKI